MIDRELCIKRGEKNKETHLLLNGGRYKVPPQYETQFLKLYVSDINKKTYTYICENRTPVFRFFMDLDIMDPITDSIDGKVTEISDVVEWVKVIQGVINEFYPTVSTTCYIASAEPRTIEKNRKKYLKTGTHLHFPGLLVKSDKALVLRQVCINRLIGRYGNRKPDWGDVVDKTVYISSGLRLLGSRKMDKCGDCGGKSLKTGGCETCHNRGKVDVGCVYTLKKIISPDGEEDNMEFHKCVNDTFHMVSKCSIREPKESESVFEKPDWYVMPPEDELFDLSRRSTGAVKKVGTNGGGGVKKTASKSNCINRNTKIYKDTMKFFDDVMPSHYSSEDITEMFAYNDGEQYVLSTRSQYCMNIAGEHRSNHVYFVIDRNCIYQKCHSRSDSTEGRNFGLCSKYRSRGRPLPTSLQNTLFPQYKKSIKLLADIPVSGMTKDKYLDASEGFMQYLMDIIDDKEAYEARL